MEKIVVAMDIASFSCNLDMAIKSAVIRGMVLIIVTIKSLVFASVAIRRIVLIGVSIQ